MTGPRRYLIVNPLTDVGYPFYTADLTWAALAEFAEAGVACELYALTPLDIETFMA